MDRDSHKKLLDRSLRIKNRFLRMYKSANAGHIGASLSCSEVLTYAMFEWSRHGDEIILSKGHAAALLYSALAERGALTEADIETFYRNGTLLSAHPPPNRIEGIPFATGSLGHGLSLAAGVALAARLKGSDKRAFCITSDGELDEGSTWEAASFIIHHRLTNVVWMIDRNNLQGFGTTEGTFTLEPLRERLSIMGFEAAECDGHDFASIDKARSVVGKSTRPGAVICRTIKGAGWKRYENTVDCHYLPMDDRDFESITSEIEHRFRESSERL